MQIKTRCSSCGSSFRTESKQIGKRVKCPKCGKLFTVEDCGHGGYDAFVCYSSEDKSIAELVCTQLEQQGLRCWIAPRNVLPGAEYGASILSAIRQSRSLVLIFSDHANKSPFVRREVERAASMDIPIITLRIEDVKPCEAMEFFISVHHWMDALTPPIERHVHQLAAKLREVLSTSKQDTGKTYQHDTGDSMSKANATPTAAESEAKRRQPESYERKYRLAFTMGNMGYFLISLKRLIQCQTSTKDVEEQAWQHFDYACGQLGITSGLRNYLETVDRIPQGQDIIVFSQYIATPLTSSRNCDAMCSTFAGMGANVNILNLLLQVEMQGQTQNRQTCMELFKSITLQACQANFSKDTINRLRSMQQKYTETQDPVDLHFLHRELTEVLSGPLLIQSPAAGNP